MFCIGKDVSNLPLFKPFDSQLQIEPYTEVQDPEVKPSLLMIICSIFEDCFLENPNITAEELIESLSRFDAILSRHPLKKILCSDDDWVLSAYRPFEGGPILIDRVESYETNPGTIGMLFKQALTVPSKFQRIYGIHTATFGDFRTVISGIIDCIDDSGSIVELKTKPAWARRNSDWEISTFIQAKLGGVKTIITGRFDALVKFQRRGPVIFREGNMVRDEVQKFRDRSIVAEGNSRLRSANKILTEIAAKCKDVGVVYRVTGRGRDVYGVKASDMKFVISDETIRSIADACVCA